MYMKDDSWSPAAGKHLDEVDSTNNYLKQSNPSVGDWVRANTQRKGRGRSDHQWHSPVGGLYLSVFIPRREPLTLNSLAMANAVVELCESFALMVSVKWPNDILYKEKKCGGILCEVMDTGIVAGVGLNLSDSDLFEGASALQFSSTDCGELAKKLLKILPKWTSENVSAEKIQTQWLKNRHSRLGQFSVASQLFQGRIIDIDLERDRVQIECDGNVSNFPASQLQEIPN
jgi:biotin-[acetyl-CoA-carboxylase] ligase BirA-like protein